MWQWCSICHYVSQVHFQSFEHVMLFWSFIIMCLLSEKWIQTKTTMYWMLNIDALHRKPVVISLNFGFAFILKFIWLNTRLMSSISISSLFLLWIWCPFFPFCPLAPFISASWILERFVTMGGLPLQDASSTLALPGSQPNQGLEVTKSGTESKPKKKICCACPETKKLRDECIVEHGEEACAKWIEAHRKCLRAEGFNVWDCWR